MFFCGADHQTDQVIWVPSGKSLFACIFSVWSGSDGRSPGTGWALPWPAPCCPSAMWSVDRVGLPGVVDPGRIPAMWTCALDKTKSPLGPALTPCTNWAWTEPCTTERHDIYIYMDAHIRTLLKMFDPKTMGFTTRMAVLVVLNDWA